MVEYNNFCEYDVIGFDEGQFFAGIDKISDLLANMGKIVIIAALDATYEKKEFSETVKLIPLSEAVTKLKAVCKKCYSENGSFTHRTSKDKNLMLIGGSDDYISLCRSCYNSYTKENTSQQ